MKTQTKQREKNTVVEMCLFQVFLFRATCNHFILFYFISHDGKTESVAASCFYSNVCFLRVLADSRIT